MILGRQAVMKMESKGCKIVLASMAALAVAGAVSGANASRAPAEDVPSEKYYKNIRVFQGLPSTQLMGAMNFMAAKVRALYKIAMIT